MSNEVKEMTNTRKPDEQAAKEFAELWKLTGFKEIGYSPVEFPRDVTEDIQRRLRNAFLAGCQHVRAKQKELLEKARNIKLGLRRTLDGKGRETLEQYAETIIEILDQILPEEK